MTFDDSRYPLLIADFSHAAESEREFQDYLDVCEHYMARRKPYTLIMDASKFTYSTPIQRRLQAEWTAKHADTLEQFCRGIAFVFTSSLVRGMATATMWMRPLPCPHHVVGTRLAAIDWCESQLQGTRASRPA